MLKQQTAKTVHPELFKEQPSDRAQIENDSTSRDSDEIENHLMSKIKLYHTIASTDPF